MKLKAGLAVMALTGFCALASASDADLIKNRLTDDQFGEPLRANELNGQYIGTCYQENGQAKTEALYWGSFTNAEGKTAGLGISTLQVYDGSALPSDLAFLLQPSQRSWDFIEDLVKEGLSGTDNNLGRVGAGVDFQYNYSAEAKGRGLAVSIKQFRACSLTGFCNPPVLQGCRYGYDSRGMQIYDECIRQNDKTIFKKETDGSLISYRSADGVGEPTNNLSFYLPRISTICRWHRSDLAPALSKTAFSKLLPFGKTRNPSRCEFRSDEYQCRSDEFLTGCIAPGGHYGVGGCTCCALDD